MNIVCYDQVIEVFQLIAYLYDFAASSVDVYLICMSLQVSFSVDMIIVIRIC